MSGQAPEAVVVETGSPVTRAVVWLHGLGADGHDFVPLVEALQLPRSPGIRFVMPHAPVRPVTINGGMAMRAWYDILDLDLEHRVDAAQIEQSATLAGDWLDRQVDDGIAAEHLVLAGFSQGGVIALRGGLGYSRRLAGIIGFSCYVADPASLARARSDANAATPVLLGHGRSDPIVPHRNGLAARALIEGYGNPVEWHDYPMEHAVCPQQVAHLRAWLLRVLQLGSAADG